MKEFNIPELDSDWLANALAALGVTCQDIQPLRVEASHRRFYRILTVTVAATTSGTTSGSLVLMVSPPALEANDRFVSLCAAFKAQGVGVPEVLARSPDNDCFVMTDLGQTHLADVYETAVEEAAIHAATAQLVQIARVKHADIEPYTSARLHVELTIFEEWFLAGLLAQSDPAPPKPDHTSSAHTLSAQTLASKAQLVAAIDMQPKCCVHRDYHSRNLLFTDGKLGVVDFQDALYGPILYDIASLLCDCYHTFAEEKIERWLQAFLKLEHVREFAARHTFAETRRLFDYTALQRQLKAIGIFARLSLRDAKHGHLEHIRPNLLRAATLAAQYAELSPLKEQLNDCVSAYDARANTN